MRLVIDVKYKTGDSFGTYDTSEILDYDWEDQNIVIENAKAIIEHYNVYNALGWVYEPEYGSYKDKWWYVKPTRGKLNEHIYLMKDNGEYFEYVCPWCGYFEHLEEVSVTLKEYKFFPN